MSSRGELRIALSEGELLLPESGALLDQRFDDTELPDGWHVETGEWTPTVDGLVGAIEGASAAVVWCGGRFPRDVAVAFEAVVMPGHDRDANAFFHAAGSIYGDGIGGAGDERDGDTSAWIVGTAGWDVHDHGLERHPDGPTWRVPGKALVPGRVVRVVAGYRAGRVFLWKDGRLLMEHADPQAGHSGVHDRVGLGTWDSAVRFRRLSVFGIGAS